MKTPILAALALVLTSTFAVACGGSREALATVDGTKIERDQVESLISLYGRRAEAEGEEEGEGGEQASHAQEVATLQVLIQREVLERKAEQLGVRVEEDEVEKRTEALRGRELDAGNEERKDAEKELEDQFRETARAQLIYEALYRKVTRNVRVPHAKVLAYYRSHLSSYSKPGKPAPKTPPPQVERSIAHGLIEIAGNEAFGAWLRRVQSEFAPMVDYRKGWAPPHARKL